MNSFVSVFAMFILDLLFFVSPFVFFYTDLCLQLRLRVHQVVTETPLAFMQHMYLSYSLPPSLPPSLFFLLSFFLTEIKKQRSSY